MKGKLFSLLVLMGSCFAQIPDAPQPKFFDTETIVELSVSGAAIGLDDYTTRDYFTTVRDCHLESNPVARPFVCSNGGMAGIGALSFAGELGGMYVVRRHRWIKRSIPIAVTIIELQYGMRNRRLKRIYGPLVHP